MNAGINPKSVLAGIVAARRESVAHRQRVLPLAVLKMTVQRNAAPVRNFPRALARPGAWNVIAELKKASPSRGLLREDFEPAVLAPAFEQAGAAALSVLTEEDFFQGSLAHLKAARQATTIPVLRKDFILEAWQVWETRAAGADSLLLIATILEDELLRELLALSRELGMEPLVEVHTREEMRRALEVGARIIGVNNRDLATFEVRLEASVELIEAIPDQYLAVSESGLRSHDDLERLRLKGFDAFLIGEHLMTQRDPASALRGLIEAPARSGISGS